jgi:uncharacterized membrane-anchored protein
LVIVLAASAPTVRAQAPSPQQGQPSQQQQSQDAYLRQVNALAWQTTSGEIAQVARIGLSNNLRFLDQAATSRFLELNGNPPRTNEFTVAPRSLEWFAIFGFERSGYVRDDERLEADALLRTLREQNQASIAERRRLNLPILRLDGWAVPPHYDSETRRLEWGTRLLDDQNHVTVNYTIRILGRSGVMAATLVSDPQYLEHDIAEFKAALRNFDFIAGERYSEFRQGDRVAEYGLAALIVGGAAAAAASSGLLKGFGKIIGFVVFGGLAAIGAFFRRLFRRQ